VKPAPFEYHAPTTTAEAVGLLAQHGDDAKPLAGGQSLVPMLALRLARFEHLVDLNRVGELRGVERANGTLRVGAMTTQATIERDPDVARAVPLLAAATPLIGHFQIRNRGTVGGSLAHADPASEYPAVALVLDAHFDVAASSGAREIPAAEFFEGTWQTALGPDELLAAVRFPVWEGRCGFACDEVARRHGDFALAGAVAAVELDGSANVARAALALFGMGPAPVRAHDAERAVVGSRPSTDDAWRELGELAVRDTQPVDDVHASASYRRRVGAHLAGRTLRDAIRRAERAEEA
jgi:carbon-monoxide dehydrogenase medium subunit